MTCQDYLSNYPAHHQHPSNPPLHHLHPLIKCLLRAVVLPLILFNVVEQKSHFALILETFVKYSHNNDLGAILINN